ncbi:hypothetical protein TcasGA2_TC010060 [Tribolium castaneum]|uniref:Uncharacterized protein n=1 Tax=Tribolium castaneum TaxID=7070 RepID=D6WS29_TRICA|nr:hypothetical protein TcasGA2_TC010060 [Tribolium castaneum]
MGSYMEGFMDNCACHVVHLAPRNRRQPRVLAFFRVLTDTLRSFLGGVAAGVHHSSSFPLSMWKGSAAAAAMIQEAAQVQERLFNPARKDVENSAAKTITARFTKAQSVCAHVSNFRSNKKTALDDFVIIKEVKQTRKKWHILDAAHVRTSHNSSQILLRVPDSQ